MFRTEKEPFLHGDRTVLALKLHSFYTRFTLLSRENVKKVDEGREKNIAEAVVEGVGETKICF